MTVYQVLDQQMVPMGFEKLATLTSAKGLVNVPANAIGALIQAEGEAVRWQDVAEPTAVLGMLLADGDTLWYTGDLSKIKFFENAATAHINCTYYGK